MNEKILALPADAARIITERTGRNCCKQKVSQIVDRGELPVVGRTVRGVRVLSVAAVERFADQLARRQAENEEAR